MATIGSYKVLTCYPEMDTYFYFNVKNQNEKYIDIFTKGTAWQYSLFTFKPANDPLAPEMVINPRYVRYIYLPQSVDEWEIKYYNKYGDLSYPDPKYLRRSGIINLNEFFEGYIPNGLYLDASMRCYISARRNHRVIWSIPGVNSKG
jgi:hypothetical protein